MAEYYYYEDFAFEDPQVFYDTAFKDCVRREEYLKTIIRYGNYQTIFPTDLCSHQHQVAAMIRYLMPVVLKEYDMSNFDYIRAILEAYIHDDHEPFMSNGDVQSADRVHLNDHQKQHLRNDEERGLKSAIDRYPHRIWFDKYLYAVLLRDAAWKATTFESELVKLADKLVGLGEALHEIQSGNDAMRRGVKSLRFKKMNVGPVEYYQKYFLKIKERLPLLASSIDTDKHWFLQSFSQDGFPAKHYNLWLNALDIYAPVWERERLCLS